MMGMIRVLMKFAGCWRDVTRRKKTAIDSVGKITHLHEFKQDRLLDAAFLEINARRLDHIVDDLRIDRADILVRHLGIRVAVLGSGCWAEGESGFPSCPKLYEACLFSGRGGWRSCSRFQLR